MGLVRGEGVFGIVFKLGAGVRKRRMRLGVGVGAQVSCRAFVYLGGTGSQVLLVDICLRHIPAESRSDRAGPAELRLLFTSCYLCLQRVFFLMPRSGVTDGYAPWRGCWE